MRDPWGPGIVNLYVQLADHADLGKVSLKIRDEMLRHVKPAAASAKPALFLQPMSKWHLYSAFKDGKNIGGDGNPNHCIANRHFFPHEIRTHGALRHGCPSRSFDQRHGDQTGSMLRSRGDGGIKADTKNIRIFN